MDRSVAVTRSIIWIAIAIAVSLLAVTAFLNDLYPHDWRDWGVAGAIVVGAAGSIVAFPRDSLGRALMWFASLTVVTLLIIYDVLDALADPFMEADWPIVVIAIVLLLFLETFLAVLVSDDD